LPGPIAEIANIAARYGLKLIEDAACAIGYEYEGPPHWPAAHDYGLL
jgi:dTDP-4-amino-4,6-dideoxygalactose transaminase